MANKAWRWAWQGGRLARRVFALFVAAALLPLLVSGWLSSAAVGDIAESLDRRAQIETSHRTARQVLERLLVAKTLLESAEVPVAGTGADAVPRHIAGLGRVFQRVTLVGEDGLARWSSDPSVDLAQAWSAARSGLSQDEPQALPTKRFARGVSLRTHARPAEDPQVLLGSFPTGTTGWIVEVHPGHLWDPLHNVSHDIAWQVTDPAGRMLASFKGEDFKDDLRLGDSADEAVVEYRYELFLRSDFASGDWTFTQRSLRTQVNWQGYRLEVWLGLLAVGTVLAVALLSLGQIRRTLQPLELLTEGAGRLAAGQAHVSVAVHRDDEIGALAGAFNHMAGRIEEQIQALEGVAAVDRDILSGAGMHRLAARMVEQLGVLFPMATAGVSWQDADFSAFAARRTPDRPEVEVRGPVPLEFEPGPVFDRSDASETLVGPIGSGLRRTVLPVKQGDRTVAVVWLDLPPSTADALLKPAVDLRDRLAVAFAVRARDEELMHQATHDGLTGLANREGLHRHLQQRFDGAGASPTEAAVLFIDLDHFKDVNDTQGHAAGDELLRQVGERLRAGAPADAVVARPGGDEFAMLLPAADEAQALAVATRAIHDIRQPFLLNGRNHSVGASVGIALCPQHGCTGADLLRRADIALYAAKAGGRGQAAVFSVAQDTAAQARVTLLAELRTALERSEFVAHYQPRVCPADGRISSVEALIRWQHPVRGLLYPGAFIELAESSGLIGRMGHWMLETACAQMAVWQRDGVPIERVSVNVSPLQLESGELVGQVRAALNRHGLAGERLELEVTESLLVGDATSACEQLSELRRCGVTVALDDFGTGYSSLATLRRLPVDVMKIDRSFVIDLGSDDGAMAVTTAIVALARSMGLKLVAEGIETAVQDAVLRTLGCDEFQGYLYSRPLAPDVLVRLPGLQGKAADLEESAPPAGPSAMIKASGPTRNRLEHGADCTAG